MSGHTSYVSYFQETGKASRKDAKVFEQKVILPQGAQSRKNESRYSGTVSGKRPGKRKLRSRQGVK